MTSVHDSTPIEELALEYWAAVRKRKRDQFLALQERIFTRAGPVYGQVYLNNALELLKMVDPEAEKLRLIR